MAIFFPAEVPIKWHDWADRATVALTENQNVHLRDDGVFQFWDETYNTNRVVVVDADFAIQGELTTTSGAMALDVVGTTNVNTFSINWSDYFTEGDKAYLAVIDANANYYMQNFMPNGDMASNDNWTLDSGLVISGGQMSFSGSSDAEATYALPLKIGSEYTVTVTRAAGTGTLNIEIKNGSGVETTHAVTGEADVFTATFTADDETVSLNFDTTGASTVDVTNVAIQMTAADCTPQWISAPFCVADIEDQMLIHGCAVNDYFNMFFNTPDFVPRIRVRAELREAPPEQDFEQYFSTSGNIVNHFVEHVSTKELRIDWLPSYLINFLSIVFFLDNGAINNEPYRLIDSADFEVNNENPEIATATMRLSRTTTGVSFKRIVNNPDNANCEIDSGAYINPYTGEEYTRAQDSGVYYPNT